jgi:hypothetical protein
MHLPQAYRSLPRPSSLIKPSHPPTGVFAPASSSQSYCCSSSNSSYHIRNNTSLKPFGYTRTIFIFSSNHWLNHFSSVVVDVRSCVYLTSSSIAQLLPVIVYMTIIVNSRLLHPSSSMCVCVHRGLHFFLLSWSYWSLTLFT